MIKIRASNRGANFDTLIQPVHQMIDFLTAATAIYIYVEFVDCGVSVYNYTLLSTICFDSP